VSMHLGKSGIVGKSDQVAPVEIEHRAAVGRLAL
jgi:hypothetical protein